MSRKVGISLLSVFTLALFVSSGADAENIFLRRGFPVRQAAVRRIANNLFLINGQVNELDGQGNPHPLLINRDTHRVVNAVRPGTVASLGRFLSGVHGNLTGPKRQFVDDFLRTNGFLNDQLVGDGTQTGGNTGTGTGAGAGGGHAVGGTAQVGRPVASITPTQPDGTVSGEACRNLNTAICDRNAAQRRQQNIAAERQKRDTVRFFIDGIGSLLRRQGDGVANAFRDARNIVRNSLVRASGRQPQIDGVFVRMMRFLRDTLPSLGTIEEQVKPSLLAAIDNTGFTEDVRNRMKASINRLHLTAIPNSRTLRDFLTNCGPDGMQEGAFALPQANQMVVCPGLILRAKEAGTGTPQDIGQRIMHVVAHEMGHTIGADVTPSGRAVTPFKRNFDQFEACLTRFGTNGENIKLGESTADLFSVETMVQFLNKKNIRGGQALKVISDDLQPLCDGGAPPEGDPHPTGAFRIQFLLGYNPGIRALLGCDGPVNDNPGCSFQGAVARGGN